MAKPKMCSYSGDATYVSSPKDAPKFIRCPVCGRRLKPRMYDSHFHIPKAEADWHYKIPPHKVKGWWKRRNK
jgi:uncharacterized C2H2 Zn-finger protein